MAVVQISRRDSSYEQAPIRVSERVTLAPNETPGWIVAARTFDTDAARARRLGIQDGTAGACFASSSLAICHRQGVGETLEHTRL
ncbi:hypothetical protein LDDCCGHA_5336 [Methylobacterium oxalidis]|nr:hypothetical protein LDDCCGHA_5336 [Methylobacterium oxalidis]